MKHAFYFLHTRAFTLIEMLISLGILAMVTVIGFGSGIDSYEREIARTDRTSLLWSVLQARAEAMNGVCGGSACTAAVDHAVERNGSALLSFEALSGLVAVPETITLGTSSSTSAVSVNSEGQVSLTP